MRDTVAYEILERRMRRKRKMMLLFAVLIFLPFVLGIMITPLALMSSGEEGSTTTLIASLVIIVPLIVGIFFIGRNLYRRSLNSNGLTLLTDEPGKIVWVYPHQQTIRYYGIPVSKNFGVMVHTNEKKKHYFAVTKKEIDAVLAGIQAQAPQAFFGYDDSLMGKWRKDPNSMLELKQQVESHKTDKQKDSGK